MVILDNLIFGGSGIKIYRVLREIGFRILQLMLAKKSICVRYFGLETLLVILDNLIFGGSGIKIYRVLREIGFRILQLMLAKKSICVATD